jgi:hypothetical protein
MLAKERAVTTQNIWAANRVMLTHFDSYSTALVFAKWGETLLYPAPLPASAALVPPPAEMGSANDAEAVKDATVALLGLNPSEVTVAKDFNHWAATDAGLIKIHLLRFTTFEAPKAEFAPHGGIFKSISELRGSDRLELALAREVFNLIIGAGGGRA